MSINTTKTLTYFKENDPIMAVLLNTALSSDRPLKQLERLPEEQYFGRIITSIISQQISVAAAASVRARVEALFGELTPERVIKVSEGELKSCGLSQQKVKYITSNAKVWHEIPCGNFVHMTDEEIITELTKLYGIGRWTAEMFLMFSLARPDVFSYGDLALMQGLYKHYNYRPYYTRKIKDTVEGWSPFRTTASLVLWHQKDATPVVL